MGVLAFAAFQFLVPDLVPPPPVPLPKTAPAAPAETVAKADEPAAPGSAAVTPAEPAKVEEVAKEPLPAPAEPVAEAPEADPVPAEPVEVKPPPPPPPSAAFRAWVQNLRIGSVRAGDPPRLQVGGVTYIPGDAVNPQLGILFDHYDGATRMIRFKDRNTGAIVERRF